MPYDPNYPPNHAPLESAPVVPVMAIAEAAAFSQVLDVARPVVFVVSAGDSSALIFHDDGSAGGVGTLA